MAAFPPDSTPRCPDCRNGALELLSDVVMPQGGERFFTHCPACGNLRTWTELPTGGAPDASDPR